MTTYPLFCRVGIVKTNKKLALVHLSEVLVQHGSLGMSDMEVTTGLGWETSDNLALLCVRKTKSEGGCGLVRASLVRLSLCKS